MVVLLLVLPRIYKGIAVVEQAVNAANPPPLFAEWAVEGGSNMFANGVPVARSDNRNAVLKLGVSFRVHCD